MNIITWSIVGTKLVIAITFFQQYMKKYRSQITSS